ncbi:MULTISPECIES: phospho-sugar mutase [unclassified Leucobacter]|uniref:phospho-sugar mutase n=1 Tax=unclassified Leucobacter TaxID=2621730 RepID=UPI00165E90AB|nr:MULTISPECIES: phospho-sugar mutase [unclassified Leucobacter]MBC9937608.1 phospho-sugar mutase [Leucobacter sp. cx-87]
MTNTPENSALQGLIQAATDWAAQDPDAVTRAEAEALVRSAQDPDAAVVSAAAAELESRFGSRLAFGTAGLRGELGAGSNRMNRVIVGQTSAGFAAFLLARAARGETSSPPSIVIGYDARVNSDVFARDTAEIMAGAGVQAILLPGPLPTPVTAFAVRLLGASAGVMVTASHNPPRDNGYKVYLGDADGGSQIAPPVDAEIAAHIDAVLDTPLATLPRGTDYRVAGPEVEDAYVSATAKSVRASVPATHAPLTIVYTAMHGVGSDTARRVYAAAGLPEVTVVPEQDRPDGAFPTVDFPNPEEPGALDLAYRTAREVGADLIVAHDPDADRLAIALPDPNEAAGYRRLTGNQLGLILGWQAAERHRTANDEGGTLACTIVSSPALRAVAADYDLDYAETLSGFKWVSRVPNLVFGFEEALGYLTRPDLVRDKDGISASADLITLALQLSTSGLTMWDHLDAASERFGHFSSGQITVRLDSPAAVEVLAERIRTAPPAAFGAVAVREITDLLEPGRAAVPSNVLRYDLADGSRVMIRPSGTEPKLKVYLDTFSDVGTVAERRATADAALEALTAAARETLDRAAA